jgi:hypothetical protein
MIARMGHAFGFANAGAGPLNRSLSLRLHGPERRSAKRERAPVTRPSGGRAWWAHFAFARINIAPTFLSKKIEDLRGVGTNAPVVTSSAGRPRAGETCSARQDSPRKSCARRSHTCPTSQTKSANRSRLNDERPAAT